MPRRLKLQSDPPKPHLSAAPPINPPAQSRQILTVGFLVIGLCIFAALGRGRGIGWQRWLIIAASFALGLVPPVSRSIDRVLGRLRNPSPAVLRWSPWCIWIGASAYLILTAFLQQRDLFPKTHDEYSYELGMRMLARGRLWMPPHPMADFFESFYILGRPVYASIYFPGTALLLAPTVWFGLPIWFVPALAGGAAAGFLFLIVSELIDAPAGWLSVLLLISSTWFRTITMMLMSQVPMLLLGLALVWAWLRWRRNQNWPWSLAIGIFAGWGAITRPLDALIFAAPVGIAMLGDLFPKRPIVWAKTAVLVLIGAGPFLLLQFVFDLGVTGHVLQTPYTLYLQREQPGATFGFHTFDPTARGESNLPQMRKDLEFSKTYFALHQPDNFWKPWIQTQHPTGFAQRPSYFAMIADTTLPARVLLILLPVGLLGLTDRRRWVVWLTFPLFVILYMLNPFFLEHYAIVLIPAAILCLLLSVEVIAAAWGRYRQQITSALTLLIVATTLTALWEINHLIVPPDARYAVSDEPFKSDLLNISHDLHGLPAVILFKWDATRNWKIEPVTNSDVVWPDDAEVIRAHDLGPRDAEIIAYYARLQPSRMFFIWDQKADKMRQLGTAADLQKALTFGQPLDKLLSP